MELFNEFISWAIANGPLGICLLFALWVIKWLMAKMINGFNDALNKSTVAFEKNGLIQDKTNQTLERVEKLLEKLNA